MNDIRGLGLEGSGGRPRPTVFRFGHVLVGAWLVHARARTRRAPTKSEYRGPCPPARMQQGRRARRPAVTAIIALLATLAVAAAGHAAEQKIITGLNLTLVKVARGSFMMGHAEGYPGSSRDEKPETKVTFTKDFWLGATEVSVAQWRYFIDTSGYVTDAEVKSAGIYFKKTEKKRPGFSWRNPGFEQTENHPVVGISWEDAMQFCTWLTEREGTAGRLPAGHVYTLPTEAQWEYAARAGSKDDLEDASEFAWYAVNSGGVLHPVGTRKPNPWGLHDMQGNVWEWVYDWYGRYPGGEVTDYRGPATANDPTIIRPHHEMRGGGVRDAGGHGIMTTNRWSTWGITQSNWVGFRIALSAVP